MKCSNNYNIKAILILTLASLFIFSACGKSDIPLKYGKTNLDDNYNMDSARANSQLDLFAQNLCAIDTDILDTSEIPYSFIKAAGVFDLKNCKTLYAFNVNERVYPASLTKVMTSLVTLENANLDDVVTVGDVTIKEDGVQKFGLKTGDKITVRDLLYIDLVYSGNDASLALASHIAGSEADFVELMNEKAKELGATKTNFVNSHGLSNDNHYTTAYDLYLIFNAAIKYDEFKTIINTASYDVTYTNANDEMVTKTIKSTNKFLSGGYASPNSAVIIGGKTGSTNAAGKCLILYSNNGAGDPFISVVMGAGDENALYNIMASLCNDTIK